MWNRAGRFAVRASLFLVSVQPRRARCLSLLTFVRCAFLGAMQRSGEEQLQSWIPKRVGFNFEVLVEIDVKYFQIIAPLSMHTFEGHCSRLPAPSVSIAPGAYVDGPVAHRCSGALGTRAPSVDWLNSSACVCAGGRSPSRVRRAGILNISECNGEFP